MGYCDAPGGKLIRGNAAQESRKGSQEKAQRAGDLGWAKKPHLQVYCHCKAFPLFVQGSFVGRRGRVGATEIWSRDLGGSNRETTLFVHHGAENKG